MAMAALPPTEPTKGLVAGIELLAKPSSLPSTLRTWTLKFAVRGKSCCKLVMANEQTAAMVREIVALWVALKDSNTTTTQTPIPGVPGGQGDAAQQQPQREVSILLSKFEDYWFLVDALRHANTVDSLWKIISRFCRGEFTKRSAQVTTTSQVGTGHAPCCRELTIMYRPSAVYVCVCV